MHMERPKASIESLQGTRKSLSWQGYPSPHAITPISCKCIPLPIWCVEIGYNVHVWRGFTSSTQWTSFTALMHISFIPDPWSWCADLWTTMESGHSMPSTHPSGMRLAGCWVGHPSMLSSGRSSSHSNGVNSTRADRVTHALMWASLLSHKGVASPCGVASRKSQLWWVTFTLPLKSLISYEGTPFVTLAYYLIL